MDDLLTVMGEGYPAEDHHEDELLSTIAPRGSARAVQLLSESPLLWR